MSVHHRIEEFNIFKIVGINKIFKKKIFCMSTLMRVHLNLKFCFFILKGKYFTVIFSYFNRAVLLLFLML